MKKTMKKTMIHRHYAFPGTTLCGARTGGINPIESVHVSCSAEFIAVYMGRRPKHSYCQECVRLLPMGEIADIDL
jgi:hypothetical protein